MNMNTKNASRKIGLKKNGTERRDKHFDGESMNHMNLVAEALIASSLSLKERGADDDAKAVSWAVGILEKFWGVSFAAAFDHIINNR
jgi:hypothetical protein